MGQLGHLSNACSERGTLTIRVVDPEKDQEDQKEEGVSFVGPDDGDQLIFLVQRIILNPTSESHP